jgi:uncharacterized RDD family membrane protein YckC
LANVLPAQREGLRRPHRTIAWCDNDVSWYYAESEVQAGPVSDTEFGALVREGRVTADTLVWRDGMAAWRPFGRLSAEERATGLIEASDRVVCCSCGLAVDGEEAITFDGSFVCPACKPAFVQCLMEGLPLPGALRYGGFWLRFAAKILDVLITSLPAFVLGAIWGGVAAAAPKPSTYFVGQVVIYVVVHIIRVAYTVYFLGTYGATPGKMACGLRVVMAEGEPISYWRALGRYYAEVVTGFTFYIGYIVAAFDAEKRTLHDHICGTRVVLGRPMEFARRALAVCATCGAPLPPAAVNAPDPVPCPSCGADVAVAVFPALFRTEEPGQTGATLVEDDVSSCFHHPGRKAAAACDRCGRFLCSLCDIGMGAHHTCAECLTAARVDGTAEHLETTRTLYDNVALALATLPMLGCWPVTLATAPTTLGICVRYWRGPGSLLPRVRWRMVIAGLIAACQVLGWALLLGMLVLHVLGG